MVKASQWFKYMSPKPVIKIWHARNGGEKVIGSYKSVVITNVSFVNGEMVRIQLVNNDDLIENTGSMNAIIAAYKTAQARLKLYSYLEKLDRRVLSADTDLIVYSPLSREWEPELGDYFRDLTNEIPENEIEVFVTRRPINYEQFWIRWKDFSV